MIQAIVFRLCFIYSLLLIKTVRIRFFGRDAVQRVWDNKQNTVFYCPHNVGFACLLGLDRMKRPRIAILASLSQDGEFAAKILQIRNFDLVRGSSSRGGRTAIRQLKQAGESGMSLFTTFDGPKGPPLVPKRGAVSCAQAVSGPVFLLYAKTRPLWWGKHAAVRAHSWDRFLVPLPFCRIDIYFEKLPQLNLKEEGSREEEQKFLDFLEKRSKELYQNLY